MREANLSRCNLEGANLTRAKMRRANLIGCNCKGTDFSGSNLYRIKLLRANLQDALFNRADLRIGADLREADITSTNFRGALYDEYTKFPPYFDPIAQGM